MQDFYTPEVGTEAQADATACFATKQLFNNLYYETRLQCIVDFHAQRNIPVKKEQAKTMRLTREEYLSINKILDVILYIPYTMFLY